MKRASPHKSRLYLGYILQFSHNPLCNGTELTASHLLNEMQLLLHFSFSLSLSLCRSPSALHVSHFLHLYLDHDPFEMLRWRRKKPIVVSVSAHALVHLFGKKKTFCTVTTIKIQTIEEKWSILQAMHIGYGTKQRLNDEAKERRKNENKFAHVSVCYLPDSATPQNVQLQRKRERE